MSTLLCPFGKSFQEHVFFTKTPIKHWEHLFKYPAVISDGVWSEYHPSTVSLLIADLEALEKLSKNIVFLVKNHLGMLLFGLDKAVYSIASCIGKRVFGSSF